MAHLWGNGPAPWQYVKHVLMRDVYHCTPKEFAEISWMQVNETLTIISMETQAQSARAEAQKRKRKK